MDEQEVRGLGSVEQVMTVLYGYWARHDHQPGEVPVPRPDMTGPANIPGVATPIEDWERRELLSPPEDDQ